MRFLLHQNYTIMRKMYKILLVVFMVSNISYTASAQQTFWSSNNVSHDNISKDKSVARLSFPKDFKLFTLNIEPLKQELFSVVDNKTGKSTIISLPNADGKVEQFEVFEASNFEPDLQARFPEIRAFSGKGITDKYASLKLSISPQGIQTMVFRTEKENEFIEPYSQDHTVYAVYKSQREKGKLPWTCSTDDKQMVLDLSGKLPKTNSPQSSAGELRTMRLAQSCNGEYANYFGAFNATQVALVLAAYNATLTRCNGCYERDLALHLNLIANTTAIIYYDPATDPYTTLGAWNLQLQIVCTTIIGEPNYDIGHMFGASGGGGNAGCIGCVCVSPPVNGSGIPTGNGKGAGITSPADGIPMGDNFDIDYVVHEVGHQLGGNHTFSFQTEGTGVNKEVGAGITIMGYAGITSYDPAPHSIDIFHEATIQQIQNNLATKTCPVTTNIVANNATPVVAAVSNYTIPITTPFALTGSATDANPGDVLTYCWEQNDDGTGQTGANSVAYAAKPTGPNWLSFPATVSGTRLMPRLSTILAGLFITPPFPGGDAICNIEALSSISRTLNFRLTVRDNHAYVADPPALRAVGQTAFTDMTVTVTSTSGPFQVTSPNTAVIWAGGSSQDITWLVNNTTAAPVSCANVKISLSTDGGVTFPTVISASTPNDGTETVIIPSIATTTARIKVEAVGNIFFDISNANFEITASCVAPTINTQPVNATTCVGNNTSYTVVAGGTSPFTYQWQVSTTGCGGAFANVVNGGVYSGATTATLNITGATAVMNGYAYKCVVTGCIAPTATSNCATLTVNPATIITVQPPATITVCVPTPVSIGVTATGTSLTYQWQESTNGGGTWNNLVNAGIYSGVTTATMTINPTAASLNGYQYRCVINSSCSPLNSNVTTLVINSAPAITVQPSSITICAGNNATFSVTATGGGLIYQWQESITGAGGPWNNITNGGVYSGATTATLTLTGVPVGMNSYQYRCVVTGVCPGTATSNPAILTVGTALVINTHPASQTICASTNVSFTVAVTGTVNIYQWQESTNGGGSWNNITNGGVYSGANTATLTLTGVPATYNTYQYRCVLTGACPPINSNAAILTVNALPTVTVQPSASTICATQNTTFSITATGAGITYQWQLSTTGCGGAFVNLANAAPYSGVTTPTLTITAAPATMNGYAYRCVVSGTCAPVATSNCVLLTVNTAVTISTQPVNSTVCAGATTTFGVVAAGTTPAYQWQESTNGGGTWNNVANGGVYGGAATNTLTLTGVTFGMNTYQYRCVVTGAAPCGVVNSGAGILTVNTAPAITTQPVASTTLCVGNNTTYSVVANGTALTYQWQLSTDGGTNYSNLANGGVYAGVTTASLTITGATAAMSTYKYRCVISGTCTPSATSSAGTLTVNTPITIVSPAGATICATGTISFSVTVAGTIPPSPYQWQESTTGALGPWNTITNGGIYSGATTTTLTLTGVTVGMSTYRYRIAVTGTAPCGVVNSTDALLTVSPRPVVILSASPYTRLRPGLASSNPNMVVTTITASVVPNAGNIIWSWLKNGVAIPVTGNTTTVDLNNLGVYTVVATLGSCTSAAVSISIDDEANSTLFIYPSPNDGRFTIAYHSPGSSLTNPTKQHITIISSLGQIVLNDDYTVNQPYQLHQIVLSHHGAGVYYVVLREGNGNKVRTGKVVVR